MANHMFNKQQQCAQILEFDSYVPYTSSLGATINSYSARRDNWCTVGEDGGCRVGEVRAGTTPPMPDHKSFKLQ